MSCNNHSPFFDEGCGYCHQQRVAQAKKGVFATGITIIEQEKDWELVDKLSRDSKRLANARLIKDDTH